MVRHDIAPTVHPSAIVDEGATLGAATRVWHFAHVCAGARVGEACSLGQNVFVGNDVLIGDRVKIQNNVSVYDAVTLEDEVFCGPSMVFTNVYNPRAGFVRKDQYRRTLVRRGASIGASWAATGKIKVDANASYEQRDYNPRSVANGAFTNLGDLDDSLRTASLRATWQVKRKVQVSAGWQHQSRSGSQTLNLGKFDANTVMVNANVLF